MSGDKPTEQELDREERRGERDRKDRVYNPPPGSGVFGGRNETEEKKKEEYDRGYERGGQT